jgi:hypothetical protein
MSNQYNINLTPEQYQAIKTKLDTENIDNFPPLFKQARNLIKQIWTSGIEATKGKPLISSAEKVEARMNICKACEFFTGERCTKCGCFMTAKVNIDAASCPLNKWWPQYQDKQVSLAELPTSNNTNLPSIKSHSTRKEFIDLIMKHKDPDQPKNFTFEGVNYYIDIIYGIPMVYQT